MNKVILLGRCVRDPEVRYSQGAQGTAVARYSLAVNRSYKKDGEPDADFINIVAFGKSAEFAGKYFKKGQLVAVEGELRINSYTDKDGNKRWSTDVLVNKQHFAESKKDNQQAPAQDAAPAGRGYGTPMQQQSYQQQGIDPSGFMPIDEEISDDDLPFN